MALSVEQLTMYQEFYKDGIITKEELRRVILGLPPIASQSQPTTAPDVISQSQPTIATTNAEATAPNVPIASHVEPLRSRKARKRAAQKAKKKATTKASKKQTTNVEEPKTVELPVNVEEPTVVQPEPVGFVEVRNVKGSNKQRLRDYKLDAPNSAYAATIGDPIAFGQAINSEAVTLIRDTMTAFQTGIKIHLGVSTKMMKSSMVPVETDGNMDYTEETETKSITAWGNIEVVLASATDEDIQAIIAKSMGFINHSFEKFTENGSNWRNGGITTTLIGMDSYNPNRGGSFIASPKWIIAKKCVINVKNEDNQCFEYALTSAKINPIVNANRVTQYKNKNLFNLSGINMPAPTYSSTFKKFERQNPLYALNVYQVPAESKSKEDLQPMFVSDNQEGRTLITLLIIYNKEGTSHYTWVKNWAALMRSGTNGEACCPRCLHEFVGIKAADCLARHEPECRGINNGAVQRVSYPTKGKDDSLEFKGFDKAVRCPFAIYLDFESSLMPVEAAEQCGGASTERMTKHVANSYNYRCVGPDGDLVEEVHWRGDNPAKHCLTSLLKSGESMKLMMQRYRDCPKLEPKVEAEWRATQICHLCGKGGLTDRVAASPKETDRVRDHDHATNEFRGCAHSSCNLLARNKYEISVFVHNLKGYDAHLLLQEMESLVTEKTKFSVIATNTEKYISFKLGDLVFKDSCQFLAASLDGLTRNLIQTDLKHTTTLAKELDIPIEEFQEFDDDKGRLVMRKGCYPYSYVNSVEKFNDTCLPPIEAFTSDLDGSKCSPQEYEFAQRIWTAAKCTNFGEYHDLYLRLDVALLVDVFESFRLSASKTYGLDPAHYYTLPGFSWDALFKYTGAKLDLLTDPDMYIACENALRGGVCQVSHRYLKANNPKVEGYDAEKPTTWLRYDDANNLYGWAMSQCLPVRDFKWSTEEWDAERVMKISDEESQGCFLECDIEYPAEIHDAHNEFPLLPEKMSIPREWLSDYAENLCGKHYSECQKLVPNLRNKTKYWIHYRNLKFALSQGLKLSKVHRVITFEQEKWMQPYINFNTQMRTKATTDFEKDLYKLMNNAVFGKTMENLRARRDIQVLKVDSMTWQKWVADPSYAGRKNITDAFVIAERQRRTLKLNKPVYVGATVLDLSKLHMQRFWYEYIKPKYPNALLAYTDTDSLVSQIKDKNQPDFHGREGSMFDTSGLSKSDPMFSNDNKKVLGKFKDENNGIQISEYVGLRPKLYSMRLDRADYITRADNSIKMETKKAKGTARSVVKNEITFNDYIQTLNTGQSMRHSQVNFRTQAHQIYTTRTTKTSLSAFDNKRYLAADGITSKAYGHYSIN